MLFEAGKGGNQGGVRKNLFMILHMFLKRSHSSPKFWKKIKLHHYELVVSLTSKKLKKKIQTEMHLLIFKAKLFSRLIEGAWRGQGEGAFKTCLWYYVCFWKEHIFHIFKNTYNLFVYSRPTSQFLIFFHPHKWKITIFLYEKCILYF